MKDSVGFNPQPVDTSGTLNNVSGSGKDVRTTPGITPDATAETILEPLDVKELKALLQAEFKQGDLGFPDDPLQKLGRLTDADVLGPNRQAAQDARQKAQDTAARFNESGQAAGATTVKDFSLQRGHYSDKLDGAYLSAATDSTGAVASAKIIVPPRDGESAMTTLYLTRDRETGAYALAARSGRLTDEGLARPATDDERNLALLAIAELDHSYAGLADGLATATLAAQAAVGKDVPPARTGHEAIPVDGPISRLLDQSHKQVAAGVQAWQEARTQGPSVAEALAHAHEGTPVADALAHPTLTADQKKALEERLKE